MTIMTLSKNLLAGLGGALALNLLHESLKRLDGDMPRIDKLGEEAVQKTLEKVGAPVPDHDNLYLATLGADLVSNALYYSAIGVGNPKHIWAKAIGLGLTAGAGAVALPEQMGLDATPVNKTTQTRSLTVGYYLFGALMTAALLKAMEPTRA
jgi:hypothetical protein